jgi:hypothetical protein
LKEPCEENRPQKRQHQPARDVRAKSTAAASGRNFSRHSISAGLKLQAVSGLSAGRGKNRLGQGENPSASPANAPGICPLAIHRHRTQHPKNRSFRPNNTAEIRYYMAQIKSPNVPPGGKFGV